MNTRSQKKCARKETPFAIGMRFGPDGKIENLDKVVFDSVADIAADLLDKLPDDCYVINAVLKSSEKDEMARALIVKGDYSQHHITTEMVAKETIREYTGSNPKVFKQVTVAKESVQSLWECKIADLKPTKKKTKSQWSGYSICGDDYGPPREVVCVVFGTADEVIGLFEHLIANAVEKPYHPYFVGLVAMRIIEMRKIKRVTHVPFLLSSDEKVSVMADARMISPPQRVIKLFGGEKKCEPLTDDFYVAVPEDIGPITSALHSYNYDRYVINTIFRPDVNGALFARIGIYINGRAEVNILASRAIRETLGFNLVSKDLLKFDGYRGPNHVFCPIYIDTLLKVIKPIIMLHPKPETEAQVQARGVEKSVHLMITGTYEEVMALFSRIESDPIFAKEYLGETAAPGKSAGLVAITAGELKKIIVHAGSITHKGWVKAPVTD